MREQQKVAFAAQGQRLRAPEQRKTVPEAAASARAAPEQRHSSDKSQAKHHSIGTRAIQKSSPRIPRLCAFPLIQNCCILEIVFSVYTDLRCIDLGPSATKKQIENNFEPSGTLSGTPIHRCALGICVNGEVGCFVAVGTAGGESRRGRRALRSC